MGGITDYLQRMRELAVQASNTAVMGDSEREAIQAEVEQLKQGISDIATQTTFNTKPLLEKVSAGRSKVGAQTNALEYAYNYNTNAHAA